jgi:signal transduction histidine kinase
MIAHDLKGPLQTINNSIFLCKLHPNDNEKYLSYIENAVKQANSLIDEFNSRGKQTPLKMEMVDLNQLIDDSLIQVKTNEQIGFDSNISIKDKILIDRSKMLRVLNNLIKNAIESMPDGGNIYISAEKIDTNAIIKVRDTGVGIPKDKITTLFRPFQSTKSKGMGLGLAFCKNTIEQHGGTISVTSKLGKGTTFSITLPINGNLKEPVSLPGFGEDLEKPFIKSFE